MLFDSSSLWYFVWQLEQTKTMTSIELMSSLLVFFFLLVIFFFFTSLEVLHSISILFFVFAFKHLIYIELNTILS